MSTPPHGVSNKKPIFKRVWFWILVVIVVIVLFSAMGGGANKEDAAAPTQGNTPAQQSSTAAEPPLSIDAGTLLADYKNNELGADQKYKGKILQVTGTVDNISDTLGSKLVSLSSGDEYSFEYVNCRLTKESVEKAATLNKGETLTVTGKNEGYSVTSVTLGNCTI